MIKNSELPFFKIAIKTNKLALKRSNFSYFPFPQTPKKPTSQGDRHEASLPKQSIHC